MTATVSPTAVIAAEESSSLEAALVFEPIADRPIAVTTTPTNPTIPEINVVLL